MSDVTRIKFNDQEITEQGQLERLIVDSRVGSNVKIEAIHNGKRSTFTVAVEKMVPQQPRRGR